MLHILRAEDRLSRCVRVATAVVGRKKKNVALVGLHQQFDLTCEMDEDTDCLFCVLLVTA